MTFKVDHNIKLGKRLFLRTVLKFPKGGKPAFSPSAPINWPCPDTATKQHEDSYTPVVYPEQLGKGECVPCTTHVHEVQYSA